MVWGNICTIFDFAHWLIIVEIDGIREIGREKIPFIEKSSIGRARKLKYLDIQVLICGAISRHLAKIISNYGILIISHIRGTVDEVIKAYLTGKLDNPRFFIPGYQSISNSYKNKYR